MLYNSISSPDRELLQSQLASLLLSDVEDVKDMIDYLVCFESKNDLLDHMHELLGVEEAEEVKAFVSNIERFQSGHKLHAFENKKSDLDFRFLEKPSDGKKPSVTIKEAIKKQEGVRKKNEDKQEVETSDHKIIRTESQSTKVKNRKSRAVKPQSPTENRKKGIEKDYLKRDLNHRKSLEKSSQTDASIQESRIDTIVKVENKKVLKGNLLKKGKCKIICGCYGTIHNYITNCTHCGRIICEKEGYDYCPFCLNLTEDVLTTSISSIKSAEIFQHKERLIKLDRESAKRTIVYDDQADYFENKYSSWLTESEKNIAEENDRRRRRDLHTIKKHVLRIAF